MSSTLTAAQGLGAYVRHQPEETLLYEIVRRHLEPFLALARERSGRALPRYVEEEFRAYLRCGVLGNGFLRARCPGCGADLLVAFSCKGRGLCPSCGVRRMTGTAAQLTDRVLPDAPVRQWVLSLPFELRLPLASRIDLLSAALRVFIDEVFRWYRAQAGAPGAGVAEGARCGAVTFVQRFGGALNLNVHFHVVVLDGVFARAREESPPRFHATPTPPSAEALTAVARRTRDRVLRALRRRGLGVPRASDADGVDAVETDALAACRVAGTQRGLFATIDARGQIEHRDRDDARFGRRASGLHAGDADGFNVHAGVTVAAGDRDGRERLCRYGARPALSLARLTRLADGRLAYRLKHPGPHGHTHRVMTPPEFLARLAALIPPPRYPLVRYHGVLAPHAAWRRAIVPPTTRTHPPCAPHAARRVAVPASLGAARPAAAARVAPARRSAPRPDGAVPPPTASSHPTRRAAPSERRVPWSELLRRVYGLDALACPRCGGRLVVIAAVTAALSIARILDHLGAPTDAVVPSRAWDPVVCDQDLW